MTTMLLLKNNSEHYTTIHTNWKGTLGPPKHDGPGPEPVPSTVSSKRSPIVM